MSKYTITLKQLLENGVRPLDFNYPIYDERHRIYLNTKIYDHFYYREIGQETPDRFLQRLRSRMNIIMPYYNQLMESETLSFNPLYTDEIKEFYHQNEHLIDESLLKSANVGTRNETDTYNGIRDENIDKTQDQKGSNHETSGSTKTIDTETSSDSLETRHDTTNQQVEGNSNRDTTGESHETNSEHKLFSDTPQANLLDNPGENAGAYATNLTDTTGKVDITTKGNEKIQNDQTTDTVSDGTTQTEGTTTSDTSERATGNVDGTDEDHIIGNQKSNSHDYNNRNINDTSLNTYENNKEELRRRMNNFNRNYQGRRSASPSELLNQYRTTILNIDQQIIQDLEILFMGVF